ncbi:unnamed protein product [Lactuca saligna]|uniref:Replication protein A subunit n=1 Tax=Lactuca saligna TaxID=75948 RepID=A0AA35ZRX0_LACSI|nr:unnamed protein product [Lactuca saligna]
MVASLDMILIDQEGSRIQATIKKILFLYLNPYSMKELSGRSVTSLWLAMKANTCLSLINIKSISTKPQKFVYPMIFFDTVDPYHFISFPYLLARNFDTRVAFDFLGEVVSTNPMRVIVEYGREKRLMNLVAQDLSGTRIAVALWGSFAMKLNTYISPHNKYTAPIIILQRLTKLKIWGGQPQVGNCLFGSRLHINDDMPQILDFKSNLNALDTNVESSSRTSQLNSDTVMANPEDYYLRFQIKNIDEIPDFNEKVGLTIIATIIGFDMDDGWYSFYCRDCSKKITKNDDDVDASPFHYDGCAFVSDVFGKIRIVVRVQDESGSSSFVLFERHVKDLIHRGNQCNPSRLIFPSIRFHHLLNLAPVVDVDSLSPSLAPVHPFILLSEPPSSIVAVIFTNFFCYFPRLLFSSKLHLQDHLQDQVLYSFQYSVFTVFDLYSVYYRFSIRL